MSFFNRKKPPSNESAAAAPAAPTASISERSPAVARSENPPDSKGKLDEDHIKLDLLNVILEALPTERLGEKRDEYKVKNYKWVNNTEVNIERFQKIYRKDFKLSDKVFYFTCSSELLFEPIHLPTILNLLNELFHEREINEYVVASEIYDTPVTIVLKKIPLELLQSMAIRAKALVDNDKKILSEFENILKKPIKENIDKFLLCIQTIHNLPRLINQINEILNRPEQFSRFEKAKKIMLKVFLESSIDRDIKLALISEGTLLSYIFDYHRNPSNQGLKPTTSRTTINKTFGIPQTFAPHHFPKIALPDDEKLQKEIIVNRGWVLMDWVHKLKNVSGFHQVARMKTKDLIIDLILAFENNAEIQERLLAELRDRIDRQSFMFRYEFYGYASQIIDTYIELRKSGLSSTTPNALITFMATTLKGDNPLIVELSKMGLYTPTENPSEWRELKTMPPRR